MEKTVLDLLTIQKKKSENKPLPVLYRVLYASPRHGCLELIILSYTYVNINYHLVEVRNYKSYNIYTYNII